jgi:hypothetical protein
MPPYRGGTLLIIIDRLGVIKKTTAMEYKPAYVQDDGAEVNPETTPMNCRATDPELTNGLNQHSTALHTKER